MRAPVFSWNSRVPASIRRKYRLVPIAVRIGIAQERPGSPVQLMGEFVRPVEVDGVDDVLLGINRQKFKAAVGTVMSGDDNLRIRVNLADRPDQSPLILRKHLQPRFGTGGIRFIQQIVSPEHGLSFAVAGQAAPDFNDGIASVGGLQDGTCQMEVHDNPYSIFFTHFEEAVEHGILFPDPGGIGSRIALALRLVATLITPSYYAHCCNPE